MEFFCAERVKNISIHAAREGGDGEGLEVKHEQRISIHAAREGGDVLTDAEEDAAEHFNPRRP